MSLNKDDYLSFEITDLNGSRLFYTETNFDFPVMYDSDDMLIENMLVIKGRKLPLLPKTEYVYVVGTQKSGDRVRYHSTVRVSSEFQINIQLRPDTATVMEERRRYFKIKTNEKAYITFVVDEADNTTTLEPPVEIHITDINVGGIFFITYDMDADFKAGQKAMIVIGLDGKRLELTAEILRVQQLNAPPGRGYGCRFLGISRSQEEIISRYIYKLQFELLQKERSAKD
ncbi:MAG: PilZ domain-containing protein [Ruminococcaceae bacterium]|nr:PilZ domain-containing protein [Oscillospiraceae bacterium]